MNTGCGNKEKHFILMIVSFFTFESHHTGMTRRDSLSSSLFPFVDRLSRGNLLVFHHTNNQNLLVFFIAL